MKDSLLKKKCIPCEKKGIKPFDKAEAEDYLAQADGWILDEKIEKISKEYKFADFIGAVNFINLIADIAEEEGHHPDIFLHDYNKVAVTLSTHSIGGLTENDFILAAKIDAHSMK
ncbi:MAG: 4a-hydroxytetrahydrobiopterin dehydratase [Candidatus Nomurabacteria bacterium]|nr:4a-hydroxytetrahydrobiopterin dehydratase [Candidatus Nomurabacteria bacterium]